MPTLERTSTTELEQPSVLNPPAELIHFAARPGERPTHWVNYATHPAYAELTRQATTLTRLRSVLSFARYFLVILCKRLISYELIPTHLRKSRSISGRLRFFSRALSNFCRRFWRDRSGTQTRPGSSAAAVEQTLHGDGICVTPISAEELAELHRAAAPLFDDLRRRRGAASEGGRAFDESRSAATRTAHAELYNVVDRVFQQHGVLNGVSAYLGHRARLIDVNPQINDPSDDFWRRIFPDLESSDRPAAYMHRDASGGDIKAIFYLSDVGLDQGPFSFVVGTHLVRSATLADWVEETNDQSGMSGTSLRSRQLFAALPMWLRRKCSFGNDVLPNTDFARRIIAAEWTITAPRGHIVLFDTKGFHRGAMVRQGERLVLTCVLG